MNCVSYLNLLPEMLVEEIDEYLSFEDSLSFKASNFHIQQVLVNNFSGYSSMQISDEPADCWVEDSRRRKKRSFKEESTRDVLTSMRSLREITLLVREAGPGHDLSTPSTSTFSRISPYTPGGYSAYLHSLVEPFIGKGLKKISVHVDVMLETIENMLLPCPTADLFFCLNYLSNEIDPKSAEYFDVFVQLSFCCIDMRDNDLVPRHSLMLGMEYILAELTKANAKARTEFVIEPVQGFADMTVEVNNLEYSFAFFYYNPSVCDALPEGHEEAEVDEDEEEEREGGDQVMVDCSTEPDRPLSAFSGLL